MPGNFNQNILGQFAQSGADVDTANGDNFTVSRSFSIYDVWAVANANAAGNVQLFHTDDGAANAITNNMAVNSDNVLTRTTTIVDAKNAFASGQVLCIKKSTQLATSTFVLFSAPGVTLS